MPLQGFEIGRLIIGGLSLPTPEEDADPFEGQGADGGVMAVAAGALLVVVSAGPRGEANRLVRILVERSFEELGTGQAALDIAYVSPSAPRLGA